MISAIFGPPGCGKSSVLTLIAQKELKKIANGKSKYKAVFTNFPCSGCNKISFELLGSFYYRDCLIILDELTLSADNRDWKTFSKTAKSFICLHRHFNIDIWVSVQDYSRMEKTVRENCVQLFYCTRFLLSFSICRPIYRTICINEYIGDLIQGYRFPSFIELITGGMKIYCIRKAWKFYNSYDKYGFDSLPDPIVEKWN